MALNNRTVTLKGDMDAKTFQNINYQLQKLSEEDPHAEVTLIIESPHDAIDFGFMLYNTIIDKKMPIKGILKAKSNPTNTLLLLACCNKKAS